MNIYIPKWMIVLDGYNKGISTLKLSSITNISYAHVHNITHELKELGYIKIIKSGRVNKIIFTKEGKKVSKLCRTFIQELGD